MYTVKNIKCAYINKKIVNQKWNNYIKISS